jgi:ribonuclease-3
LQEWAHSNRLGTPKYREAERTGPDHDPVFTVVVQVEKLPGESGRGRSKRVAEQNAATAMLIREGVWKETEA